MANVDANMIKIVFRNLLTNAIKFSNKGSEVFLEATKENNSVKIFIKDQGVGIAAEDIPLLFDSLTYTKPGTENEKGTGLGLVLCKAFIEKNKGSISVESRPEQAAHFVLCFLRHSIQLFKRYNPCKQIHYCHIFRLY